MSEGAAQGLTGRWAGWYGYAGTMVRVEFEAELIDLRGGLSGDTTERNTFRPDMGAELHAEITGSHTGGDVRFRKVYVGFAQDGDPVYIGQVRAGGNRIDGEWHFPGTPGDRGPFLMIRAVRARAAQRRFAVVGVP